MRSIILFPCLLVFALALTLLLWPQAKPAPESFISAQSAANQVAQQGERTAALSRLVVAEPLVVPVAQPVEQFAELAMSDDSADLNKLLRGLTDADSTVRAAAVEAVVQFGSREALPALQTALSGCADFHEAGKLQAAIDFLELSTVAEVANK